MTDNINQTLAEIRDLMRNSKKSYLSGYAPLCCGIVATAAWFANIFTHDNYVVCIALASLVLGIAIPFIISVSIAKNAGIALSFNHVNRQLFFSLFVPVLAGAVVCVSMYLQKSLEPIPAMMMIFYGLGLFNFAGYSHRSINWCAAAFLLAGAVACFTDLGLLLWAFTFGGVHIVYGFYLIRRQK